MINGTQGEKEREFTTMKLTDFLLIPSAYRT